MLLSVGFLDKIAEKLQCDDCGETGAVACIQPNKLSPGIDFKCIACSAVFCSAPGASVTSVDGKRHNFDGKKMCLVHDSLMNGGGYAGYCSASIRLVVSGLAKSKYYNYVSFLLKEMDAFYAQMKPKVRQGLDDVKHAGLRRVRYAALAMTLEHNFGTRQGSLMAALGLLNEKALHAKEKKDRTPLKPPRAKRRRVGDEEAGSSTGYAPGNF